MEELRRIKINRICCDILISIMFFISIYFTVGYATKSSSGYMVLAAIFGAVSVSLISLKREIPIKYKKGNYLYIEEPLVFNGVRRSVYGRVYNYNGEYVFSIKNPYFMGIKKFNKEFNRKIEGIGELEENSEIEVIENIEEN